MVASIRIVLSIACSLLALPGLALAHPGHGASPVHTHASAINTTVAFILAVLAIGLFRFTVVYRAGRSISE